MGQYQVSVSRIISAPAAHVYAILTDYRSGHPSILPPQYFKKLTVEEGGQGAGTVAVAEMEVMGSRQTFRLVVSEPEPGCVLAEEDAARGTQTRFILDPLDDDHTRVTIATDARTAGGLRGILEQLLNPPLMRRIYSEELELLDAAAQRAAENG